MDHKVIKAIISYLIIASIFITGTANREGITFYWYYPLYIAFILYVLLVHPRLNLKILAAFVAIVLYALLTFKAGFSLVVKQVFNIGLHVVVFYFYLWFENFDSSAIFSRLIRFAKIVLVLGFVQVFLFQVGLGKIFLTVFPFVASFPVSTRLQSITQEPSYIAFVFAPIVFASLHNIFYRTRFLLNRTWSVLFVAGYLLTLSSIAYLSVLIMLLLLYFKNLSLRKLQSAIFVFAMVSLAGYAAYSYLEEVRVRVDDTIHGLTVDDFARGTTYLEVNISTFALLSNLYVTKKGFLEHPITGHGLGTHELVYEEHIPDGMRDYRMFGLNKQDANSLALRIISELGLVGITAFLFFVFAFKARSHSNFDDFQQILWLINTGIFVLILLALLRNGNYTVHGKVLFFLLYYYTWKELNSSRSPGSTTVPETDSPKNG